MDTGLHVSLYPPHPFRIEEIRGLKEYLFFYLGYVVLEDIRCFVDMFSWNYSGSQFKA
jgi:hypothetical protein